MMALARRLGYADGPCVRLAFQVEAELLRARSLHMNIAALAGALAADQGLSPQQYYRYRILSFSAGIIPCFIDSIEKPEGSFFPLRCSRIAYEGKPRRSWDPRPP
jgi:hypothetical protein